jgi:hypothetical protein
MKCRSSSVIFVCVFVAAVTIAGCTTTINNSPSPTAGPPVATPTPTPTLAIGSTLNLTSMLDLSQVHWYKYQIITSGTVVDLGSGYTTAGSTMTERWDFNVNYNGKNADEVTGTANYPSNGATGTTSTFLDHTDHNQYLGGNMKVMKDGKEVYKGDVTPTLLALQSLLDLTNSTYSGPHTVTYGGIETVTVPLGTYTTTKYMYSGAYDLTVYMNTGVPVPIKVKAVTASGTIYNVELMGWG